MGQPDAVLGRLHLRRPQDYRRDTPLQCTIDGVAVAQFFIFGMFGVDPQFDGPHSRQFTARGLRAKGRSPWSQNEGGRFDIEIGDKEFKALRWQNQPSRPWAA